MKRIATTAIFLALLITLSGCKLKLFSDTLKNKTSNVSAASYQSETSSESVYVQEPAKDVETVRDCNPEPSTTIDDTKETTQEETIPTEPIAESPSAAISGVWSLCHDGTGDVLLLKLSDDGTGIIKTYYGEESFKWSADNSEVVICRNGTTEKCPYSFTGDFLQVSYQGMPLMFHPKN